MTCDQIVAWHARVLNALNWKRAEATSKPWLDVALVRSRQIKCPGCGHIHDKSWGRLCADCSGAT